MANDIRLYSAAAPFQPSRAVWEADSMPYEAAVPGTSLKDVIDLNTSNISSLSTSYGALLTGLDGRVAANETDIAALQTSVDGNTDDISGLQTDVDANTAAISNILGGGLPAYKGKVLEVADEAARLALAQHTDLQVARQLDTSQTFAISAALNPGVASNWVLIGDTPLTASEVNNDSSVAGTDVAAALNTLLGTTSANSTAIALNYTNIGTLQADLSALDSDDVQNLSGVPGATVTAALDDLAAALVGVSNPSTNDVGNDSTVPGTTATAALNNHEGRIATNASELSALQSTVAALTSSDILNGSSIPGGTTTDALEELSSGLTGAFANILTNTTNISTLTSTLSALSTDDVSDASSLSAGTTSDALEQLATSIASNASDVSNLQIGLGSIDSDGVINDSSVAGADVTTALDNLNTQFGNYVPLAQKGAANGVATLDATGKIPGSQITGLQSRFEQVADEPARLALPQINDLYIVFQQDTSETWYLDSSADPAVPGNWVPGPTSVASVPSVFGRTGPVVAGAGDYTAAQVAHTQGGNTYVLGADVQAALDSVELWLGTVNSAANNVPDEKVITAPAASGWTVLTGLTGEAVFGEIDTQLSTLSGQVATNAANITTKSDIGHGHAAASINVTTGGNSYITGGNAQAAFENCEAHFTTLFGNITALGTDDVTNESTANGGAGTATDALNALESGKAEVGHTHTGSEVLIDDIGFSNISGATSQAVFANTDFVLGILQLQLTNLDSDDIGNESGVSGADVTTALDTLDAGKAAVAHTHTGLDVSLDDTGFTNITGFTQAQNFAVAADNAIGAVYTAVANLGSDDIDNESLVGGGAGSVTTALNTLRTDISAIAAVQGDYLRQADNLSDLADAATARSNLALGTMATETAANYMQWTWTQDADADGNALLNVALTTPLLTGPTEKNSSHLAVSGNLDIDYRVSTMRYVTVSGPLTIRLIQEPPVGYSTILRFYVEPNGNAVDFASTTGAAIYYEGGSPAPDVTGDANVRYTADWVEQINAWVISVAGLGFAA